jgi:hypothetical protein
MIHKTDNPAHVGKHVFELSGCGKAPFKFVGYFYGGGSCDHCGTGIVHNFVVRDVEGKEFKVGCVCIDKTSDTGLIHAYKTSPEYRAANKAKAKLKDDEIRREFAEIINDGANRVKLIELGELDRIEFVWPRCGATGRKKWLKITKALVE